MRVLRTGIPAAGIAAGTAFVLERRVSAAPSAAPGDPAAETARFHAALAQAKAELGVLAAENDIFAAHLEMADDPMLAEQVEERISEHGFSAERALDGACEEVCGMLAALDDEYLGGRTDDVRDVCGRIRRKSVRRTCARNDRRGRGTDAVGYGADGFQPHRGRGDGPRKRHEPCLHHRPRQRHCGEGRRD